MRRQSQSRGVVKAGEERNEMCQMSSEEEQLELVDLSPIQELIQGSPSNLLYSLAATGVAPV